MPNGFEPGRGQGVGLPRREMGGFARCRCPSCGYTVEHARDFPCNQTTCPKCGSRMIGG